MTSTLGAAFALAMVSIACTEGAPPRSGAVVRDSAGVEIVENDAPAWGMGEAWRISDTPRQRIGAVEGDLDRQLFRVQGAHRFDDGTFLARAFPAFWTDPETGLQRFQDTYLIVDAEGAIIDTIGEYPGEETYIDMQDGSVMSIRLPFARASVSAVGAGAFFYGANEMYRIDEYSRDGRLVRSIRLAREARTPTASDVEAFIGDLQAQIPEQARAGIAAHYRSMPLGESFPFYSDLKVDTEGHLWVEDYLALPIRPSMWSVFDPEGQFLGSVTLPARFTPYQIGSDFVLGRWEDELEVEYVDVYDLLKPR